MTMTRFLQVLERPLLRSLSVQKVLPLLPCLFVIPGTYLYQCGLVDV